MHRFYFLAVLALSTLPRLAFSQSPDGALAPPAIRAWYGATLMFSTDLDKGIGAGYDARVTIERPDVAGVTVLLGGQAGIDEEDSTTQSLFGAFLGGRSFPVADDVFLHLSAGLGYARTDRYNYNNYDYTCDPYSRVCNNNNERTIGAVVPIRAELHVPFRRDRAFGIVAQTMLFGDVPQRLGIGLHYSFGRNLSDRR